MRAADGGGAQLAAFASVLADKTRATFCLALLDGRAWTAGELARHAGVAPSTATEHVTRLVAAGLLAEERQGRHRYVRLAGPGVAELLEDMAAYLPAGAAPRSLRAAGAASAMARARTCYDHLAGRLGVRITEAMTDNGLVQQEQGCALTSAGFAWFAERLEVDITPSAVGSRPVARSCLDWTERRPHLAGAAGAALCGALLNRRWVIRIGSQRAVQLSPAGVQALRRLLDVDVSAD